ncbi:MAG: hypothetical protein HXY38_06075 [Chloroflexi bacterium]|nr:hypothetical protein [Chloroflexota bacterium]
MSSFIAILMLAVILGAIIFLFWRQNRIFNELGNFYKENNLIFQPASPVEHPFMYPDVKLVCSAGMLRPNIPYTLILGTRLVTDGQGTSSYRYIGVYLPPQAQVNDEWLSAWQQKVAERSDQWAQYSGVTAAEKNWGVMGAPEHLPVRAVRVNSGVFIGWSGIHTRKTIEARLNELKTSLPN